MTTSDGGDAFGIILYCLCMLVMFAVHFFIIYWVYNDARKRGNPNAVLWAVVTFLSNPLGLILYLILGRNQGAAGGAPPAGPADPGATTRY
jgi:hypothetical protein